MDDTCAECGHLVDDHDRNGCLWGWPPADEGQKPCPCTADPDHYDPSDD